jgi:hypothetical protein
VLKLATFGAAPSAAELSLCAATVIRPLRPGGLSCVAQLLPARVPLHGQAGFASNLGRRPDSARAPDSLQILLFFFQVSSNQIQTSKIDIYLNIAPKFMKPVLLSS